MNFISPRKESDRGGILCMMRVENLPADVQDRHPDWKLMDCPRCGKECWKPANADELQRKQGVKLMCTACALRASMQIPKGVIE